MLHVAVQNNDLSLAKKALEWGVSVNAKNNEGNTALLLAALNSKDTDIPLLYGTRFCPWAFPSYINTF